MKVTESVSNRKCLTCLVDDKSGNFCTTCGTRLVTECEEYLLCDCGDPVDEKDRFCGNCGVELSHNIRLTFKTA